MYQFIFASTSTTSFHIYTPSSYSSFPHFSNPPTLLAEKCTKVQTKLSLASLFPNTSHNPKYPHHPLHQWHISHWQDWFTSSLKALCVSVSVIQQTATRQLLCVPSTLQAHSSSILSTTLPRDLTCAASVPCQPKIGFNFVYPFLYIFAKYKKRK